MSGPLLGIRVKIPAWKDFLGKALSRYVGRLSLKNEIDPRLLSHDLTVVKAYMEDPLVHQKVSARWFTEILQAMEAAHRLAPELKLPVLILHGEADELTDPVASQRFAQALPEGKIHLIRGAYHEVFLEEEPLRQEALRLLKQWLGELLPPESPAKSAEQ